MPDRSIAIDDPRREDVLTLLQRHLGFARSSSPPEDTHALEPAGLLHPTVTLISLRDQGRLLAIGALKNLDETHEELKSIHTAEEARRSGAGRVIVKELIATARRHGATRVSLETGSTEAFAPSRALYRGLGFVECEPFGDYSPSRNSTFMTLELR